MTYISKEEVLEFLDEMISRNPDFDEKSPWFNLNDARKWINQLKTTEENSWIPVEEKLPEEWIEILAYNKNYHKVVRRYWNTYQYAWEYEFNPTHWQPLPQPPTCDKK